MFKNRRNNIIPRLVCCGNMAFDLITGGEDESGEYAIQGRPGGSVLNVAMLASKLNLSVCMAAKTSKDFLGDSLVDILRRNGIDTSYVLRDPGVKTSLAFARIDKNGESSYLFYKSPGLQTAFSREEMPSSLLRNASAFHSGSAHSYGDFTFGNILKLMDLARKEDCLVSYDPNWRETRIKNRKKALQRVNMFFAYSDILKLSEEDALGITGKRTLSSALRHMGRSCFLTLGRKGSLYWNGREETFCPAFKTQVVDTIGAGDAFTAALIHLYCFKGKEKFLEESRDNLRFASAVSALACAGRGATEGLKNLDQVRAFLKANPSSADA